MQPSTPYAFELQLPFLLPEAERIVREALLKEQFGIISEIDISAKLQEKLGIDHPPHKILGACNPRFAYNALQENPDVALALPCNVVLRQESNHTVLSALLPSVALQPFQGSKVYETACRAEEALSRTFDEICSLAHPPPVPA